MENPNNWGPEAKPEAASATSQEIEVVEPHLPEVSAKKRRKPRITDGKLDAALADLNLLSISSEKLKGFSIVGRFLDQIGIVQYGNGRLVGTAEAMAVAMKACAEVVSNAGNDSDLKERFIMLQIRLAKALDANAVMIGQMNETTQSSKPQTEQQNKPFAVQSIVTPIQITVQSGSVANPVAVPAKDV